MPPQKRASLHAALLLSGFAALVYELSWTRMLQRVFGVGDLAVATVLAAFFGGLGLGSWLASRYAERVTRPARAYAALELAIAAFAFVSPFLVPWVGHAYTAVGQDASGELLSAWRLGVALLLLLPPTVLMGATLPILAKVVSEGAWAKEVTGLYVTNTLGAVLGAGAAGLWLLPRVGGRISTWIAAGASLAAAALVVAMFRGTSTAPRDTGAAEAAPDAGGGTAGIAFAASLAAGTGLASLAGEVLWTRLLRTVLHATTQAFAAMLVCYLLGIALGGLLARRLARSKAGAATALAGTQLLAGIMTVGAMAFLPHLVRVVPLLRGQPSFVPHEPSVILAVAAALLLPLALVLGTGLPLAWKLAESDDAGAARGTGALLAANTLGGLVGSLLAGFALVPLVGIEASLFVVVFIHMLVAGLAARRAAKERSPVTRALVTTGPLIVAVLLISTQPTVDLPYLLRANENGLAALVQGPGEAWREPIVFLREGRSATVTVERRPTGLRLYNDGRPESGFGSSEPGFGPELALLGGMPTLFGPAQGRAMVIGLGAGHTTSLLLAGGFERVDVVELEAGIVEAARLMHEARETPFPLDDPRARLVIDDARNRLALADAGTYDAVVSQPSHPWLAGSSALYTREFFEEVDRALSDGGVFSLWVNLFRIRPRHVQAVVRTLTEVFPHVQGFIAEQSSLLLCATKHPAEWGDGLDAAIARLERYLGPQQIADRAALARHLELDGAATRALGAGGEVIVDDRPMLEFELARTPPGTAVVPPMLDRLVRQTPWWSEPFAERWSGGDRSAAFLGRVSAVEARPLALERVADSLPHAGLSDAGRRLVSGAIAEARGDVRGALEAYDAAADPRAASRADRLRLAEDMPRRALRVAASRSTDPELAAPLLRAALRVDAPWAYAIAIEVAERVARPEEQALRQLVSLHAAEPCRPWRVARPGVEGLARGVGEVAFVARVCADAEGDREAAIRLSTLSVRARRAAAEAAWEAGERCRAGGNGGCALMNLRRALRTYPSHSRAAASLATLLVASGRRDDARAVLLETLEATEGIDTSRQRLAAAAAQLGIELPGLSAPVTESPTSIAPSSQD